jgi:hypothetical protein
MKSRTNEELFNAFVCGYPRRNCYILRSSIRTWHPTCNCFMSEFTTPPPIADSQHKLLRMQANSVI